MYFMVLISQANCRNKSSDPGAHDQYFQLGVFRRAICHRRCLWRKIAFDHIVSVGTNEPSNCLEEWAMEMNISLVLLSRMPSLPLLGQHLAWLPPQTQVVHPK
jgi:hypothetical protein